ncbi:MAG: hypothetical protein J5654_07785 [Victivallales bacterium]|nr:hypothetical protein [Victivallales bacterium]
MQSDEVKHHVRKLFLFLTMFGLLWICSGCLFRSAVDSLLYQCYDDILIVERRGEISEDGKNLTVYLKKRTDYRRDPFHIWKGSFEEEATHTYPLTHPETDAVLQEFEFIPPVEQNRDRVECLFDVNANHNYAIISRSKIEEGQDGLFLPAIVIYNGKKPGSHEKHPIRIHVHPDDVHLLAQPFVWRSPLGDDDNALVVPYKQEGNICYAYMSREDLIGPREIHRKSNLAKKIWTVLLWPPAFVLDVVTSPVQAIVIGIAMVTFSPDG